VTTQEDESGAYCTNGAVSRLRKRSLQTRDDRTRSKIDHRDTVDYREAGDRHQVRVRLTREERSTLVPTILDHVGDLFRIFGRPGHDPDHGGPGGASILGGDRAGRDRGQQAVVRGHRADLRVRLSDEVIERTGPAGVGVTGNPDGGGTERHCRNGRLRQGMQRRAEDRVGGGGRRLASAGGEGGFQ